MNRFDQFTDGELYILKRQAIESSFTMVMSGKYDKTQAAMHTALMNEVIAEIRDRKGGE